jgi:hypothetical protein
MAPPSISRRFKTQSYAFTASPETFMVATQ